MPELIKFEGTFEEFIELIDVQMYTCLKRPRGRKIIQLFYEDMDKWFINEFSQKNKNDWDYNPKENPWLIITQMPAYLQYMCGMGKYEMYTMSVKVSRP